MEGGMSVGGASAAGSTGDGNSEGEEDGGRRSPDNMGQLNTCTCTRLGIHCL